MKRLAFFGCNPPPQSAVDPLEAPAATISTRLHTISGRGHLCGKRGGVAVVALRRKPSLVASERIPRVPGSLPVEKTLKLPLQPDELCAEFGVKFGPRLAAKRARGLVQSLMAETIHVNGARSHFQRRNFSDLKYLSALRDKTCPPGPGTWPSSALRCLHAFLALAFPGARPKTSETIFKPPRFLASSRCRSKEHSLSTRQRVAEARAFPTIIDPEDSSDC